MTLLQTAHRLHNLISLSDLSQEKIIDLLDLAETFQQGVCSTALAGKLIGCCFFEPSTRTRFSFEAAIKRLGGSAIGFSEIASTSISKGESFVDSLRVFSNYVDAIVLRHPAEGAAKLAAEVVSIPLINAGDGSNQHPTQALVDLYTMRQLMGCLHGLHIGIVGDLRYSRTVRSLAEACALFQMRISFVPAGGLLPTDDLCNALRRQRVTFSFHETLQDLLGEVDILYMTRIQKERAPQSLCSVAPLVVTRQLLEAHAKLGLKILHPLPRQEELPTEVDATPYAAYFQQAENGLAVRQALLSALFYSEER